MDRQLTSFLIAALITVVSPNVVEELCCDFESRAPNQFCNYNPGTNQQLTIERSDFTRSSDLLDGPLRGVPGSRRHVKLLPPSGRTFGNSLESNPIRLWGNYCLSLDFYVLGDKSQLRILATHTAPLPLWNYFTYSMFYASRSTNMVDKWYHVERNLKFSEVFDEYFVSVQNFGTVHIDNIKFVEGSCPRRDLGVQRCDFDNVQDLSNDAFWNCDWLTPTQNNTVEWKISSSGNDWRDKTTNSANGFYLTTRGSVQNRIGELQLREFHPEDGKHCFSFWITYPGNWVVVERATASNIENVLISSIDVDDGPEWRMQRVTIDPVVDLLVIVRFQHKIVTGLDGFELRKGACPRTASCNFEEDLCEFVTEESIMFGHWWTRGSWFIGKGNRKLKLVDEEYHNYDIHGGNVLYGDFTNIGRDEKNLNLISRSNPRGGTFCLVWSSFVRDMRSTRIRVLTGTNARTVGLDNVRFETRNTSSRYSDNFAEFKVSDAFSVYIRFEAEFAWTILEIKKFEMEEGTCEQFRRKRAGYRPEFPAVTFHCEDSGHHIPKYRICDGVIDCPMGEDEGEHCHNRNCSMSGIRCKIRNFDVCLEDTNRYCDGVKDCEDGIDEDPLLCNKETFCSNYCIMDGTCLEGHNEFACRCDPGYIGKRCQFPVNHNDEHDHN